MFRAIRRTVLAAGFVGIAGYGAYEVYWTRRRGNALVAPQDVHMNQQWKIQELYNQLGHSPQKALDNLKHRNISLLQYSTCPFSSKVRTFLDLHRIPYKKINVDPFTRAEIKLSGYTKVPQLHVDDNYLVLVDSYEIVSILAPVVGQPLDGQDIDHWRKWSSDVLAKYLVVNMNARLSDMAANARYVNAQADLSAATKAKLLAAGGVMFAVSHLSTKTKLANMGYDTTDIKAGLDTQLAKWCASAKARGRFHGGQKPDLADSDVFGIIRSLEGHDLYREIETFEPCKEWVASMQQALLHAKQGDAAMQTTASKQ